MNAEPLKNIEENTEEAEIKKEKKKKKKELLENLSESERQQVLLEKFDPKSVQILLKTLSRNHYNLLRMVDNKASIVLTMNSIIISLLMGVMYLAPESEKVIVKTMARILVDFGMLSMIFALISMLPHKYIGKGFKKSKYKGTLYAGNFAAMSLDSFKMEFERIMLNGGEVYNEMVEDMYFLGKSIAIKQKILVLSVFTFLIGLVIGGIYSFFQLLLPNI